MDLDPHALRNAFGTFMTGVTVVTAHNENEHPIGFTANSFTSVSLDPPLVLVCLANSSSNREAFVNAAGFAVNVLSETQVAVSNTFARPAEDRFANIEWKTGPQGSPVIEGVTAWFDCAMYNQVEAGDHVILIGEVKAYESTPAPGLGYARGAYVSPSTATDALVQDTKLFVSALIERNGQVLLVDDGHGGSTLPECAVAANEGASAAVRQLINATGLSAEPGFIYSVFEDPERKRQHISFLCQAAEGDPTSGVFVPAKASSFDDVSDPAFVTMLERFVTEYNLGNFGIYFGTQKSGEVRTLT